MGTSASAERRDVPRRPFTGPVVLAHPDEGDGYEADGVDLSVGGMCLRTQYLPDVRSELECRFQLESGEKVAARAEVIWAQDSGDEGGAFGLRFTDLPVKAEGAIRDSVEGRPTARPKPAQRGAARHGSAPAAAPVAPEAKPADENRVKLHVPGMDAPLRARVRTRNDNVLVLGSDLSFLKLGQKLEVERAGERAPASIEDVNIEVDPRTNVARLVLTLTMGEPGAARTADEPAAPMPMELRAPARARGADTGASQPVSPDGPTVRARRSAAHATAVLASHEMDDTLARPADERAHAAEPPRDARESDADVDERADEDAGEGPAPRAVANAKGNELRRGAPPAWLLSVIRGVRTGSQAFLRAAGPTLRKVFGAVVAAVGALVAFVRARIGNKPAAPAVAPTSARANPVNPATGLRKQQVPAAIAPAAPAPGAEARPRRKIGMYVLAAAGLSAIIAALLSGRHAPRARTPRPQVAVAAHSATTETATESTATTEGTAEATTGTEGAATPTGELGETPRNTPGASATATARGAMPPDLVGAGRSRSADPGESAGIIRNGRPGARAAAPAAPARAPVVASAAAHAPAAAPAAQGAHSLGASNLQSGTVLRLRMDGPVTALSGGPGAGNTLVIRVAGRRSLDMAAPLVRQDGRLVNAGIFNRGGNAELTLRFREGTPVFSAHGRGNTLEIVLAPTPHRAAGGHAAAPLHPAGRNVAPIAMQRHR